MKSRNKSELVNGILVVKTVVKVSSIKKNSKFYNLFSIILTLLKMNEIFPATFFTDW